jgi:hypothetical protein
VKEHPILFSAAMIRAILDGRKTQTRRVLGVQPLDILTPADKRASSLAKVTRKWDGKRVWFALTVRGETIEGNRGVAFRCKYGEVGDRLWVREAFAWMDDKEVWYRATDEAKGAAIEGDDVDEDTGKPLKFRWTPSIYMPRWASRITLELTGVRVERLQDITEADAIAEGVDAVTMADMPRQGTMNRYTDFAHIWEKINAKRGYGWDANPWVWALTFKRVTL